VDSQFADTEASNVIASAAKQSRARAVNSGLLRCARNDGNKTANQAR
jgi:hypothetical protein